MPPNLLLDVTFAAGSVGDTVYARNQHGPYTRARTVPTDPNTALQQTLRRAWQRVQFRWRSILTPSQRTAWREYGGKILRHGRGVGSLRLTGQQAYVRVNQSRAIHPLGFVDDPPQSVAAPVWTTPVNVIVAGPGIILFTVDPADTWAVTDLSAMLVFVSAVRPATVNFFKGPWRLAMAVLGSQSGPPAATQFATDPWGTTLGARRWIRSYVLLGDGRVAVSRIQPFDDNA